MTGSIEALETDSTKDAVLAARIAYWNLIQSTKTPDFYGFTENLRGQDAISCEKGRVAAIQFLPDGRTLQTIFPTSQSLQEYLASASNDEADGEKMPDQMRQPLRRLIILEDLPRNCVEVSGSYLRINPAFFATHWADPITERSSGRRFFLYQSSGNSFILQSPQMHCIVIVGHEQDSGAQLYQLDAHIYKSITKGPE